MAARERAQKAPARISNRHSPSQAGRHCSKCDVRHGAPRADAIFDSAVPMANNQVELLTAMVSQRVRAGWKVSGDASGAERIEQHRSA